MKIKGAIFDLDGTLLDSMHIWQGLSGKYLKSKGIVGKDNLLEDLKTLTLYEAADYLCREYKMSDKAEDVLKDLMDMLTEFYEKGAPLKPGAAEFLEILRGKNVSMCVATSSERQRAEAALKRNGTAEYFCAVLCGDEIGSGKDKPDIFLAACDILGTEKSETLVFEDAFFAAKTAKEAGFLVCGVYDRYEPDTELMREICDFYIESFERGSDLFD